MPGWRRSQLRNKLIDDWTAIDQPACENLWVRDVFLQPDYDSVDIGESRVGHGLFGRIEAIGERYILRWISRKKASHVSHLLAESPLAGHSLRARGSLSGCDGSLC
jgi:hypothetical protein